MAAVIFNCCVVGEYSGSSVVLMCCVVGEYKLFWQQFARLRPAVSQEFKVIKRVGVQQGVQGSPA
jgi:hypothetical protein